MARIRTIKPSLWTDEALAECSLIARLLFVASLNFADDNGNLERSARQLKAQAFPYDDIDCEPLIAELVRARLLIEYEVGDRKYLHIKGFLAHQRIDRPSKCSLPVYEASLSTRQPFDERSTSPRAVREGKGKEGKVRKGTRTAREAAPSEPIEFADFKKIYPARTGDQGWPKALRAARARIREGHRWAAMLEGAQRYAIHVRCRGDEGSRYVKQAATFLGRDLFFLQPWDPEKNKAELQLDSNIAATNQWLRDQEIADAKH